MPPAKKRNLFTFVVDLSEIKLARNVIDLFLVQRNLCTEQGTPDEAFLILMNCLHEDIKIVTEETIALRSEHIIDLINKNYKEASKDVNPRADWGKALSMAVKKTKAFKEKGIQTRYIILISSLNGPVSTERKYLNDLQHESISLIICINQSVNFNISKSLKEVEDLQMAFKNISISNMNENIAAAIKVVVASNGAITGKENVLDFIAFLANRPSKQDWNEPLKLGTYEFPTVTRKLLEKPKSLIHKKYGNLGAKTYHWAEHSSKDFTKGYNFAGKPLAIPFDIACTFKQKEPRSFQIICFIKQAEVPELLFGGGETYYITARGSDERATVFNELVDVMQEKQMYAVASRIYNAGAQPKLYLLKPQPDGWFLMPEIPKTFEPICKKITKEFEVPKEDTDSAMHFLREFLVSQKKTFHPQCALGIGTHLISETVREHKGYVRDDYELINVIETKTMEDLDEKLSEVCKSNKVTEATEVSEKIEEEDDDSDW